MNKVRIELLQRIVKTIVNDINLVEQTIAMCSHLTLQHHRMGIEILINEIKELALIKNELMALVEKENHNESNS